MTNSNPCATCNPRTMAQEGCCTTNVGFGTKFLIKRRLGIPVHILEVCSMLVKLDDGSWGCQAQIEGKKPQDECYGFGCERQRNAGW